MSAPTWLVVGVILFVVCKLAIQAAVALDGWASERESDEDERELWHRKLPGPDARGTRRFDGD